MDPTGRNLLNLIGDVAIVYFVPFAGGYFRLTTHEQYLNDQQSYDNIGVSDEDLYNEAMSQFHMMFWAFLYQFENVEIEPMI